MKEELSKKLRESYPDLFKDGCSLEIGDGWFGIIDTLSYGIELHLKNLRSTNDWHVKNNNKMKCVAIPTNVRYNQIKEKFGTLRVYMGDNDDYINGMTHMAEAISGVICEECGSPGTRRNGSWIRTLCNQHFVAGALNAPDEFMDDAK